MNLIEFLHKTHEFINSTASDAICIIVGNETCDLDSAVCALSLAHFYQCQPQAQSVTKAQQFLPVLNIKRQDFVLKTEVKYLFQQHGITMQLLTFRDDLQIELVSKSDFILVDHHVSPHASRCVEVYDHRPYDSIAQLPANCKVHLQVVGSCASLIAARIFEVTSVPPGNFQLILVLLRSTIILDTINFADSVGIAKSQDQVVCAQLEQLLAAQLPSLPTRAAVFETLRQAIADTSLLTPLQILRKDCKLLTSADGALKVALVDLVRPLSEFIQMPDVAGSFQEFVGQLHCQVVLLMSFYVLEGGLVVQCELGLINVGQSNELCDSIRRELLTCQMPALDLVPIEGQFSVNGSFYTQRNVKVTRKQVLPIVRRMLAEFEERNAE